MATISIILEAVNRASGAFNDAADSAAKLDVALDAVQQRLDQVDTQLAAVAATARTTAGQLSDAGDSADVLNLNMAAAAGSADNLAGRLDDAATAATRLAAMFDATGRAAGDLRDDFVTTAAAAQAAASRLNDLSDAAIKAAAATNAGAAAARAGALGWGLWGDAIGALTTKIPLWGGLFDGMLPKILTQVAGWHVLADAILEVIAVWGPAAIAIGVFAAAASQGVLTIYQHMNDLLAVVNASPGTAAKLDPLTGGFLRMQNAVQPAVYELWGDAINVAASKAGTLLTLVNQLVPVVDQLGARMTAALESASVSVVMGNAVTDVKLLGTSFGDLFGVLGNLIRMNAGWAGVLLQTGTDILGVTEKITSLIIPLGNLLVLGHGFVLWVGLAVTGVAKLIPIFIGWGAAVGDAAVAMFALATTLPALIAQFGLMDGLALAGIDPIVAIGAAVAGLVAGLAVLVIWLGSSKDATEQWGASMQKTIAATTDITAGLADIAADQTQVTSRLAAAQAKLNDTQADYMTKTTKFTSTVVQLNSAYAAQATKVDELTGIQQQLNTEAGTADTRIAALAKTYGGTSAALGLLNAAGVTTTQIITKGSAAWQQIQVEVAGANAGLQSLANTTGMLGNEEEALGRQVAEANGAATASVQKVVQAYSDLIGAVTATQSSFDTYAQGITTLSSDTSTFTLHLGNLEVTGTQTKAAIDSLSTAGVNLNQAFTQQVGNVNSMTALWLNAGLAANVFKSGVAASIAPLEQYARGSSEATAQLVALGEEAGYQGPNSLADLNKFLGITSGMLSNTAGDLQTMKDAADQATIQEALLTSAMNAQGNQIASQLIGDINQAILAYKGVGVAAKAYGTALAQYGAQSSQAHEAQNVLNQTIIAAGKAAGDTTTQIAAMIAKIDKIPLKLAIQIVMTGTGTYKISGGSTATVMPGGGLAISPGSELPGGTAGGAARGTLVRGGIPGRDSVLIAAMPGELVVPTPMVRAGEVDHLRGRIPGFAAGGVVQAGNSSVLSGQYGYTILSAMTGTMETAMVGAMRKGMGLYDSGGLLPPGLSLALNQTGSNELVLPNAVVQGFTMGLQQLHSPLSNLVGALNGLATATEASAAASKTSATATTTAAAQAKKAAPPSLPSQITSDEKKITADKANAAMLASHIAAVEQAIKDTPAKDKTTRSEEAAMLKTLQSALSKQDTALAKAQAQLKQDEETQAKSVVAAMQKQIEAITKLLASNQASTLSPAGLWSKLAADEKTLAQAQASLADLISGKSGGSSAPATQTAANTASSASSLASIKSQINAQYTILDNLYNEEKTAKGAQLTAIKAQVEAVWTVLDALYKKEDAATGSGTSASSSGSTSSALGSSSTGSAYTVVIDRKAENDLDQILVQLRQENGYLKQAVAALAKIQTEADPKAQAAAIGPAVASALNSTGRGASNSGSKTSTRKG